MINWFFLRFLPSIAIRIVSCLKYRDMYRIVRVPYRYDPKSLSCISVRSLAGSKLNMDPPESLTYIILK